MKQSLLKTLLIISFSGLLVISPVSASEKLSGTAPNFTLKSSTVKSIK